MKVQSAKSKGRNLQNKVTFIFRDLFKEILQHGDIKSAPMGTSGVDVVMSPSAMNLIVFSVEAKNQEKLIGANLSKAIEQSESNSEPGRIPVLIFKKNNNPERIILKLSDFIELFYPNKDVLFHMDDAQKILVDLERIKQQILKHTKPLIKEE